MAGQGSCFAQCPAMMHTLCPPGWKAHRPGCCSYLLTESSSSCVLCALRFCAGITLAPLASVTLCLPLTLYHTNYFVCHLVCEGQCGMPLAASSAGCLGQICLGQI